MTPKECADRDFPPCELKVTFKNVMRPEFGPRGLERSISVTAPDGGVAHAKATDMLALARACVEVVAKSGVVVCNCGEAGCDTPEKGLRLVSSGLLELVGMAASCETSPSTTVSMAEHLTPSATTRH